jgi:hypothetical protein
LGRGEGSLVQRLDGRPYRGKRLRVRAAIRSAGRGAFRLWCRVERGNGMAHLWDGPAGYTDDWRDTEVVGNVDLDAAAIVVGVSAIGEGQTWIDDVRLDVAAEQRDKGGRSAAPREEEEAR